MRKIRTVTYVLNCPKWTKMRRKANTTILKKNLRRCATELVLWNTNNRINHNEQQLWILLVPLLVSYTQILRTAHCTHVRSLKKKTQQQTKTRQWLKKQPTRIGSHQRQKTRACSTANLESLLARKSPKRSWNPQPKKAASRQNGQTWPLRLAS